MLVLFVIIGFCENACLCRLVITSQSQRGITEVGLASVFSWGVSGLREITLQDILLVRVMVIIFLFVFFSCEKNNFSCGAKNDSDYFPHRFNLLIFIFILPSLILRKDF